MTPLTFDFRRVQALLLLQWQELRRDRGTLFLNFVFPVLFIAGLYLQNLMNPALQFKFALIEDGPPEAAARFVQQFTGHPSVSVRAMRPAEADAALRDGSVHAILQLPAQGLEAPGQALQVRTTPRFEELTRILLDASGSRLSGAPPGLPYTVAVQPQVVRSDLAYAYPGILAMALVQLGLFATAVPLLQARERGTLRYLLITPARASELLLSQVALRILVAGAQLLALLAAGQWLLGLGGIPWAALAGAAVLGVVMLVAIGYAIAGMAPSLQVGMSLVMVANFALLFGGNIFWDPNGSVMLTAVAHLVPLSYLSDLFRQLITGAKGMWPAWVDVAAILAWSTVAVVLAARTLRFDTVERRMPRTA
jgi:ABC-2 type transport system permease protein